MTITRLGQGAIGLRSYLTFEPKTEAAPSQTYGGLTGRNQKTITRTATTSARRSNIQKIKR